MSKTQTEDKAPRPEYQKFTEVKVKEDCVIFHTTQTEAIKSDTVLNLEDCI